MTDELNLIVVCSIAFLAVLILLSLLAVVFHFIVLLFPERKKEESDSTVVAAVNAAVHGAWPGATVTRIEEVK